VLYNLHTNLHVQRIAACMILVGGAGVALGGIASFIAALGAGKCVNAFLMGTQLIETFIVFFGARFIVFPWSTVQLIADLKQDHTIVAVLVGIGFALMMFFNVILMKIKTDKMISFFKAKPEERPKLARQNSSAMFRRQNSATMSWLTAGEPLFEQQLELKKE
jgi:hypothetical protein